MFLILSLWTCISLHVLLPNALSHCLQLSDLVWKAREVVESAQQDSSALQAMASAARDAAVAHFNALAMLDSVVWSLLRIKEMCSWEVRRCYLWPWCRDCLNCRSTGCVCMTTAPERVEAMLRKCSAPLMHRLPFSDTLDMCHLLSKSSGTRQCWS